MSSAVGAVLDEPPAVQDVDPVGVADVGQPVRDEHDRTASACAPDALEEGVLGAGVQRRRGLVADQQRGVAVEAAGHRHAAATGRRTGRGRP